MERPRNRTSRLGRYLFDIRTLPADLVLRWRLERWRGIGSELRSRTLHRIYRRGRFLVYSQDLGAIAEPRLPDGVTISEFRGPDWSPLASVLTRRWLERYRRIADRGRVLLVAWRHEVPIGYTWYSDRIEPRIEVFNIDLPEGTTYGWGLYVIPSERNRGIGTALVAARLIHARRRGFKSAWRIMRTDNEASRRISLKTAASREDVKVIGELVWVKLLSYSRTRFRPVPESGGSHGSS